jgi:hypothetical protein
MNKKQFQSCDKQQRCKDARKESWHRVKKDEHEVESKHRLSKAVFAKFGRKSIQKVKRGSNATS